MLILLDHFWGKAYLGLVNDVRSVHACYLRRCIK